MAIAIVGTAFLLLVMIVFVSAIVCGFQIERSKNNLKVRAAICIASNESYIVDDRMVADISSGQRAKLRLVRDLVKYGSSRKSPMPRTKFLPMKLSAHRIYAALFRKSKVMLKRMREYTIRHATNFKVGFLIIKQLNMNNGGKSDEHQSFK